MRTRFIILAFLTIMVSEGALSAQNCQWLNSIAGNGDDGGLAITTDIYGGVCTAGTFQGTAIFDANTSLIADVSANFDGYIARYSSGGTVLWVKQLGVMYDQATPTCVNAVGQYLYVAGVFNATMVLEGDTFVASGSADIFLLKLALSDGSLLWIRTYGGAGFEYAESIAADANSIRIAGGFEGTLTLGSTTLTSAGSSDILVAGFDTAGLPLWARRDGGIYYDYATSIALDPSGNSYIGGIFNMMAATNVTATIGTTTMVSYGMTTDNFLLKCGPAGTPLWARQIGGNGTEYLKGITVTSTGGACITGTFDSPSISFVQHSLVATDVSNAYVASYDASGTNLWATKFGGPSEAFCVAAGPSGEVYVAGNFTGPCSFVGSTTLVNSGTSDIFVTRINQSGIHTNVYAGGGFGDEYAYGIACSGAGTCHVTGTFGSWNMDSLTFGSCIVPNVFIEDAYVLTVGSLVSIDDQGDDVSTISIFPNPFTDGFTIMLPGEESAQVILTDMLGREVYRVEDVMHSIGIDGDNLASGVYVLSVRRADDGLLVGTAKVVKQ